MSAEVSAVLVAFLNNLPFLILVVFICLGAFIYRQEFRAVLHQMTKMAAFGVEFEFKESQAQLSEAIESYRGDEVKPEDADALIKRGIALHKKLNGAHILWLDDSPLANEHIYRFLRNFGIHIHTTTSQYEAVQAIRWAGDAFDLIVTDMNRDGDQQAGINFINELKSLQHGKAILVFVGTLIPGMGTPDGAKLITDDAYALITEIFTVLEKKRPA